MKKPTWFTLPLGLSSLLLSGVAFAGPRKALCTEGPAFAAFANAAKSRPTAKEDLDDYEDPQRAMRCKPANGGDTGISYAVRAMKFDHGDSQIQIEPSGPDAEFGPILGHFDVEGDSIRWTADESTVQFPPAPKGMAFVWKKTPRMVAGKEVYSAEYFDGGGSSVALSCEPRWSIESNILAPTGEGTLGLSRFGGDAFAVTASMNP